MNVTHPAQCKITIADHEHATLEHAVEPRRRVAIVGFADSSRDAAPYDDPTWEIWGLNQLYRYIPRADRWFELHDDFLHDQVPGTDYLGWLRAQSIPVYMIRTHRPGDEGSFNIPNAVRYPIERTIRYLANHDYFMSTIAFMVATALQEPFEEIGLWGVDLIRGSEWEEQRPNVEWLLGIAMGQKRIVTVHKHSAIMKALYRYGYEDGPSFLKGGITREMIEHRVKVLEEKINWLKTTLNAHEGMMLETRGWSDILQRCERGVTLTEETPAEKAKAIASATVKFNQTLDAIGVGRDGGPP